MSLWFNKIFNFLFLFFLHLCASVSFSFSAYDILKPCSCFITMQFHDKPPDCGKFVIICPDNFTFAFFLFYLHMITKIIIIIIQSDNDLKLQAMRNLAVSITYREWQGPRCGLLPSLAHLLKTMRPLDNSAGVGPPSPPFCSREDDNDWMTGNADWWRWSLHLENTTCKSNSNKIKMNLNVERMTTRLVILVVMV